MRTQEPTRLIIAASETDADLHYATQFLAPDAFIFLQIDQEKILLMSDLELDRARSQAKVDTILPISQYQAKAKQTGIETPNTGDALHQLLQEKNITHLQVPRTFPISLTDDLRERGYALTFPEGAFWPEREIKTQDEIEHIRQVQRHTENAMDKAIDLIRSARIQNGILYHHNEPLTSEAIKHCIRFSLMENECTAHHTIVACGDQACDPHNEGTGPLRANQAIIIDIFPKSDRTGYFADITRTVVKGTPSAELQNIYDAVLTAQTNALDKICAGAEGKDIHQHIVDLFETRGYKTGQIDGRMQGYFHGTGHGLGLEIHEPPRIGKSSQILQPGHIVTVEPGLYYLGRGAVRIEDLVVVTENGCENLTTYPKFLSVE